MLYACLYAPGSTADAVRDLALEFSPYVEQTHPDTMLFCIDPLRKLLGSPYQIASNISHAGHERKLQANLAIATNPDTSYLLAHHYPGVTLATPGEEAHKLAPLPLSALTADWAMLDILLRWGVKTCADLTALPAAGVAERLGPTGVYLRNLALGLIHRPLRIPTETTPYERRLELEHPIALLEPLLFLFASALGEICTLLRSQGRAARLLEVNLTLAAGPNPSYQAQLEFPVPLTDPHTMLKLLQLHLERHSPQGQITAFHLRIEPVAPRRVQSGLFLPAVPQPDKLQITLARIAGMVGEENVGSPLRLNTHRPDAFRLAALNPEFPPVFTESSPNHSAILRLVIRLFRPALEARVNLVKLTPKSVHASGVNGHVLRSAGPWKTSGEWWAETAWTREEWDVALDDGALYRIYQESQNQTWYVQGVYD